MAANNGVPEQLITMPSVPASVLMCQISDGPTKNGFLRRFSLQKWP